MLTLREVIIAFIIFIICALYVKKLERTRNVSRTTLIYKAVTYSM